MAQYPLGDVKPNSTVTALRITNNLSDPTKVRMVQAIQFQALGTNSDGVYIVSQETPDLTLHVLCEIPKPSSDPQTRPTWTIGNPSVQKALNAAEFWVLPKVSGEGVRGTAVTTP